MRSNVLIENQDWQPPSREPSEGEPLPATQQQANDVLGLIEKITNSSRPVSTSDGDWEVRSHEFNDDEQNLGEVEFTSRFDESETTPILGQVVWRDEVAGRGSRIWQIIRLGNQPVIVKQPSGGVNYRALLDEYGLGMHDVSFEEALMLVRDLSVHATS